MTFLFFTRFLLWRRRVYLLSGRKVMTKEYFGYRNFKFFLRHP